MRSIERRRAPVQSRTSTAAPDGRATRWSARPLQPHDADRRTHRTGLGRAPTCSCTRWARGPRRCVPTRASGPASSRPAVRALFAADPLAARIPVVLVHGLDRQPLDLRRDAPQPAPARLRPGLFLELQPAASDIARCAADLGAHIERICEQTGHERVHVVGHSLGGLIARYHVQRQGGDRRVESLVTLGHAAPGLGARARRPDADDPPAASRAPPVLQELAEPAPDCRHPGHRHLQRPRPDRPADRLRPLRPPRPAAPATCSSAASATCRCPMHRGVVDEVAATLAGRRAAPPSVIQAA